MNQDELKQRTKQFALRVIHLVESLPKTSSSRAIGSQLLRSGTSVYANYRARSRAEFIAKMEIVAEESDESAGWIELPCESGLVSHARVSDLMDECNQLTSIAVSSIKTARKNLTKPRRP